MLFLFSFLLCFPSVLSEVRFNFEQLGLPSTSVGPTSSEFDSLGRGPYTSISDGRIVRYDGPNVGFVDFAFTSPNRSRRVCDGTNDLNLGPICGRSFGIRFYLKTGELFIADAYRGLVVAGPGGGLTTTIATSAEGQTFKFVDGVDVDQLSGHVYFTDASSRFSLSQMSEAIAAGDKTGRLLKYNPSTKQVTVLLKGLAGAAGVAVSSNGAYVLVTEFLAKRVRKLWLSGPKANTSEVVVTLKGRPDKIRRINSRFFWVAMNVRNSMDTPNEPKAVRINGDGKILETLSLVNYLGRNTTVSVFNERNSRYYLGSLQADFLGVLDFLV